MDNLTKEEKTSHFEREDHASDLPLFAIFCGKLFLVSRCQVMLVKETDVFGMHVALADAFNTSE